jgi:hypothetical protein
MLSSPADNWLLDTHLDGFKNKKQISLSFESYWVKNDQSGLRDVVAATLGMFALLRSDNQRRICLSELSIRELEDEGHTPCYAVVVVTRSGKTNKDGKVNYAAVIRNKDVFMCPMSFLAFYLFDR